MPEDRMKKPLSGVTILDFTRVLAGPYCTAMLADQGAEVIKIEAPGGDDQRAMGAFRDDHSLSFEMINRNKASLRLDLRNPEGVALAQGLARKADVIIENFRPGVAKRLGIGAEKLCADTPGLIYCSISGFGQSGPMSDLPSYDIIAQAYSGMMSITGTADGPPTLVGESIGDILAGIYAAQAISAALYRRSQSGEGCVIDVAMFDALFSLLPTALAMWQREGQRPGRSGNQHPLTAPFGSFQAADGPVMIAVANAPLFAALARAMGRPGLPDDPRFASDQLRTRNADALRAEIEGWAASHSVQEVVRLLGEAGVPASPIWAVDEAATSDQTRARGLLDSVPHPVFGSLQLPEQPVHFQGIPRGGQRPAPALGADGPAILRRHLDLDDAEIARLGDAGII